MMRSRLLLAVFLAVLLIGAATWKRVESTKGEATGSLVALTDTTDASTTDITNADSSVDLNATTSTTSSDEHLTDTDVMSRQLFSDYVSLEANGQATPDNLDALGDEYAASIASGSQAQVVYMIDINTVSDSKANIQSYSDALSKIYNTYSAQLVAASKVNIDPNTFGPTTIAFAQKISAIYQEEADALKIVPVPNSLAADDLKLINFYLSSAWNMLAISNANTDPADAYSGIASETSLGGQEQTILIDIQQKLVSDGIILSNS